MRFAKFVVMPDEQPEPNQRETEPELNTESNAERSAPVRRSYVTEDRENPLICRGID